jgi:hypothetical protein
MQGVSKEKTPMIREFLLFAWYVVSRAFCFWLPGRRAFMEWPGQYLKQSFE